MMSGLEKYFNQFRENIVGIDETIETPFGRKTIQYADWLASGRLYKPIEDKISNIIGPYVGNTHTETSETGILMSRAYQRSHELIKEHVNAGPNDVIITAGFGLTTVINKFQRILGLKYRTMAEKQYTDESEKPVVFITHMEHHSNHTSWYETNADVVIIEPGEGLKVNPDNLRKALEKYKGRQFKIGSFTACSNVTGIKTPYHKMAKIMHEYGGVCFIDFAAIAPYDEINMHPDDPMEKLDAVMFSPHKFLGGPGTSGVLVFDASMYKNPVPDHPGGGTVEWTNPWGEYKYIDNIEEREDGGTPGFLQSIKTALCFQLKKQMGVENMKKREKELLDIAFKGLVEIPGLKILVDNERDRLSVISFCIEGIHYNLLVRLLNDLHGIQVRGGCACAGTYGHYLLEVSHKQSVEFANKINHGDLSDKPGWVRWSLHPTTTNNEVDTMIKALDEISLNINELKSQYTYNIHTNTFWHINESPERKEINDWFKLG